MIPASYLEMTKRQFLLGVIPVAGLVISVSIASGRVGSAISISRLLTGACVAVVTGFVWQLASPARVLDRSAFLGVNAAFGCLVILATGNEGPRPMWFVVGALALLPAALIAGLWLAQSFQNEVRPPPGLGGPN